MSIKSMCHEIISVYSERPLSHHSPIGDVYVVTYTPTSTNGYAQNEGERTKWCRTDSGNVTLLDARAGISTSTGMSELDRVYARLRNTGGGDGVPSRDTDFGEPDNEVRCECICMCIDACTSSGDMKPSASV